MDQIARIVPNVTGLDKSFDYAIPPDQPTGPESRCRVGTIVRVDLHGRRIGGWIEAILDADEAAVDVAALKPIAKITGYGPDAALFELAAWASVRWAARRSRPFLVAASPMRAIPSLPPERRTRSRPGPVSPATRALLAGGGGVLRLPPRSDVLPAVRSAIETGPTLIVTPTISDAQTLAARLRRSDVTVALMPDEWAAAAGGVDVVIGARSAAWAPCPGMTAAVVIDEHDEALQEERTPTWHARDVVVERCRRAGVPCVLVSPAPTLTALVTGPGSGVVHPAPERERAGWPVLTVVDRTDEEPWKKSLVTSALIERLRNPELRVVCISNITGRARVLACRQCRSLIRCENCDAAIGLTAENRLHCRRCSAERPPVCQVCGASSFANLRPGVSRLREELEGAAARPVAEITAADDGPPPTAAIVVGTEAALYRIPSADVVAFLEFDSEMLAPRFRAAEQALALIIRAGRLAPEVMVQTFSPDHDVLRAAVLGDPATVADAERVRREMLRFPPFGALARVSGSGSGEFISKLAASIEVGGDESTGFVLRSNDWQTLGAALNAAPRPSGARLRIEVDPPRL